MKKNIIIIITFAFVCLICNSFTWQTFKSKELKCEVSFPSKPNHIKQIIPLKEINSSINYNAFLSILEDDSVCMLVVADFPMPIIQSKQNQILENFLNGIINYRNEKKLKTTNFSKFNNLNALDFVLEKENRNFKGKAIINKNKLYLLAMEHDNFLNLDSTFETFLKSLKIQD